MKLSLIFFAASAAALAAPSVALAGSPSSPINPSLRYFDIRGAAENARVLLALGGMEYDDVRYLIDPATFKSESFLAAKENGDLFMNLDRAPVLAVASNNGGATTEIGQSRAIERYLARKMGLMGRTAEEEAVVDCIAEHCRDVKDAASRKGFSKFTKGKTDEEKATAREEWFRTDMPEMLRKIDAVVERTGAVSVVGASSCSVGSDRSYADVAVWALLRDCSQGDADDTARAAEGCAKLNAIADDVAAHPGVAKWLDERPETMF